MAMLLSLALALTLSACASIDPQERRVNADRLANAQQWKSLHLAAGRFVLAAYLPPLQKKEETLTVYIEGDGFAWLTRSQPSNDPTPRNPVALQLALRHGKGAVAYLARPCQYVKEQETKGCEVAYWTQRRFAPEVIEATSLAIDALKQSIGASKLVLVGYSGGGAVAALVAAGRQDVVQIATVAGNLDHFAWTALHGTLPLEGSINPADAWESLQNIPQLHFVGESDHNVSIEVTNAYLARFPPQHRPKVFLIKGFDHVCCWVDQWPELSLLISR